MKPLGFVQSAYHYCLDFLFPKPESVHALESLSAGELSALLPPARDIDDPHLIVLFDYKDSKVKELIWELKYKGNRNIGNMFAEILMDVLRHELAERQMFENFKYPLLVPMPISDKRKRSRGWNQTEILGEALQKLDPNGHTGANGLFEYEPNILKKRVHTDSQARTHATKRERMENLNESMIITNKERAHARSVILLDDVTTSGATFAEAKRALKEAGVKKILCIALAH